LVIGRSRDSPSTAPRPGPEIRASQGQLIEVHLRNKSVADGVTLHWHGVDVPNAMDGVAGVTQDAVPVGGEFTYRFVAEQPGTYWYHSHQVSNPQVARGLLGSLVVTPRAGIAEQVDVSAVAHT
jgi:FtsP/CotA-like multicopper oxidase with cupredoxin domain